ncbi:hypothetical protein INT45_013408 [Circinella minor]|uniref:Uncharacterized protein n=1 Tax=Circinella minor TaxID=1195481 RepID=A0A8H7S993_9FUNG|nr:hypothetical protein INT45_013408 [Circinella minor]
MTSENSLFEDDAFAASQSLEQELLGKGYNSLGPSSLAAELHSATSTPDNTTVTTATSTPERLPPNAAIGENGRDSMISPTEHDLHQLVVGMIPSRQHHQDSMLDFSFSNPPSPSLPWSPTPWLRSSRRSSYSGTESSNGNDNFAQLVDDQVIDPFEYLKRQLEDLNSAVWETKTLHKRMLNTLLTQQDNSTSIKTVASMTGTPPLELVITSVINLIERKSKDRERQTSSLKNIDSSIRKEGAWMTLDMIRELDLLVQTMKMTLHDPNYAYQNPLPSLHQLHMETTSMTDSLEELKEIMYVNKRQVQELNSRLRSIAKTVHEVRKDIRRINKKFVTKDDNDHIINDDPVVLLEKGQVDARVKEIMCGLDDLDKKSSSQLKEMQLFWEQLC